MHAKTKQNIVLVSATLFAVILISSYTLSDKWRKYNKLEAISSKRFSSNKQELFWTSRRCKSSDCWAKPVRCFYGQFNQDLDLWKRYYNNDCICKGTYLEIGAFDGASYSNTLFFRNHLNWKGVLIEPLPNVAKMLKKNRPQDYTYAYSVCPKGQQSTKFTVNKQQMMSHIGDKSKNDIKRKLKGKEQAIPCYPGGLAGILHDAGILAIDFFSLDVEDSELIVLQTMDWSIPVGVFMVEMSRRQEKKNKKVREYLTGKGYVSAGNIGWEDELFEHPNYLDHIRSLK